MLAKAKYFIHHNLYFHIFLLIGYLCLTCYSLLSQQTIMAQKAIPTKISIQLLDAHQQPTPKNTTIKINDRTPFLFLTLYNNKQNQFVQIDKQYMSGYQAHINKKIVPVLESHSHKIMVLLTPGVNHVKIQYKGTDVMNTTSYICLLMSILLMLSASLYIFKTCKPYVLAFLQTEFVRLIILFLITAAIFQPFFYPVNEGAGDAHWYFNALRDALEQLHHHVFPVYVGQSIFNYFGNAVARAPFYLLLGQFLDIITFFKLNALAIQHLTVLVVGFVATFLTYYLLLKLNPKNRWAASAFAIFYVTCPGVITLIYVFDSYYSFMTVAFMPLLIYGMIRTHQKNDTLSALIIAAALSLLWMSHPPIALWSTAACGIFYLIEIFRRTASWRQIATMTVFFILFSAWFFISVSNLGVGTQYIGNQDVRYPELVTEYLHTRMPGVFLPFGFHGNNSNFDTQLGYTFWLVIFVSLILAFRKNCPTLIKIFLASAIFIFLFLYPLPIIGQAIWSLTPGFVRNMTVIFANQRLYIILAGLSCFLGMLCYNRIIPYCSVTQKKWMAVIFVILLSWDFYEMHVLEKKFLTNRIDKWWISPTNINRYYQYQQIDHGSMENGTFDPILKNKLVDEKFNLVPGYDNEEPVIEKCLTSHSHYVDHALPISKKLTITGDTEIALGRHIIPSNRKYLICMEAFISGMKDPGKHSYTFPSVDLELHEKDYFKYMHWPETSRPIKNTNEINQPDKIINSIAIDTHHSQEKFIKATLVIGKASAIEITKLNIIPYDTIKLPITIQSVFPYRATVNAPSDHLYLQLYKEYYPGYQATVNGKPVPVEASPDKFVLIPLLKGDNEITLAYKTALSGRISFYVSALAWGFFIIFLVISHRRKYNLKP